ncbi:MAG TPA: TetR-like C-terminal domain-containing protein [Actinophytocola sp.]|uniref:TetR-like C-terminal domain-containing protein n=1 Tax=Actinophytocola sp. TaxID=1872138 RepID=UPI002DFFAF82|nr:TetR-like C-terminal domain-containing protein [Actinophytocola sp.]
MASVDQVKARPGGRNAQVRARVFEAVRRALESGDPENLAVDRLAEQAGVHRATIYRRWLSTERLMADLLVELTPLDTPLPDTGTLREDLEDVLARVAGTVGTPAAAVMLRLVAGSADGDLAEAARGYWAGILDRTAEIIRRAQRRGDATPDVDAVAATESLLGPVYFRLLVSHEPITDEFRAGLVDRTLRLLSVGAHG